MASRRFVIVPAVLAWLVLQAFASYAQPARAAATARPSPLVVTVSMDQPSTHYFHVELRIDPAGSERLDVKMPAWTPGYYQVMDYARNVLNFRAESAAGQPVSWEKTAKNTWRLDTRGATGIVVQYDVYAFSPSVADSYLDDARAFICPAGVIMHVGGRLANPVTLTVRPAPGWKTVSTGLDPVPGQANAFTAPDMDVLYDSPVLAGNHEVIPFDVRGVRHELAGNNLGVLDRTRFIGDLAKMIDASAQLMGELPYSHYAFLVIGPGGGGLEHLNSTALTIGTAPVTTREAYVRWLAFVTHEYFHLFNVKRIRPIALGPFDYDRENYTRMLWVSEGFTVYYEDLVLNRAGLLTRGEVLERAGANIARFENAPGHLFQSAVESSFDTWIKFFARTPNLSTTTISYYDKGAALGMLLDLAIRHHSGNRQSLDDVMRTLYRVYYKEKQRGFTDAEFRDVCERAAGVPLAEIFDVYAATTRPVDYAKYLAYAGLQIDTPPADAKGTAWGAATQEQQNGTLVVSSVILDSPAARAGVSVQDEVLAVDGTRASSRSLAEALAAKKPGDRLTCLISRRGTVREVEVRLDARPERLFRITPVPNPGPLEQKILESWLR